MFEVAIRCDSRRMELSNILVEWLALQFGIREAMAQISARKPEFSSFALFIHENSGIVGLF